MYFAIIERGSMEDRIFLKSEKGYFGEGDFKFGGCFVPEILYPALDDLQKAYKQIFQTKGFQKELKRLLKTFVGRPTPLIYAKNASEILGNEIYLKFEGLANTGAHKINNALAQVLLAKRMKKTRVIAETGAGQHGVAVASVCAFLKMPCTIFMGAIDVQRQRPNVFIMEQFGAEVVAVESGTKTLKDAVNEALRQWSTMPHECFYVLGSALGPYPYPDIVRDSQAIIGKEIKKQIRKALSKYLNAFLPDYVVACVGGGSNSMGAFNAFLEDMEVKLVGVEAGGDDFKPNRHAMRLAENSGASIGVAHGYRSYFLQDKHGQISNTHSISAGLDYAGVGPQLAHLKHIGRVEFMAASDDSALEALQFFARHEGILPALESSHALAGVLEIAKKEKNKIIVVNVSGRGDKDIFITAKALCTSTWRDFLESELRNVEKLLKQKNKAKEVIIQEETNENESKERQNELKLALQDISHEDMNFFDSVNTENEEADIQHLVDTQISPATQTQRDTSLTIAASNDFKNLDSTSTNIQNLEELDSNLVETNTDTLWASKDIDSVQSLSENQTSAQITENMDLSDDTSIQSNMKLNLDSTDNTNNEIIDEFTALQTQNNNELESSIINPVNDISTSNIESSQNTQEEIKELEQESIGGTQTSNSLKNLKEYDNINATTIDINSSNTDEGNMKSFSKEPLHFLTTNSDTESNCTEDISKSNPTQENMQILHFLQDDDLQEKGNLQINAISTQQEVISHDNAISKADLTDEFQQELDQTANIEDNIPHDDLQVSFNEKDLLKKENLSQDSAQIESNNIDSTEMLSHAEQNISLESLLHLDSNMAKVEEGDTISNNSNMENSQQSREQDDINSNQQLAKQLLFDLHTTQETTLETLEDLQHLATQHKQIDLIDETLQESKGINIDDELALSHVNHIQHDNDCQTHSDTIESSIINAAQQTESISQNTANTANDILEDIFDTNTTNNIKDEQLGLTHIDDSQTSNDESQIHINTFDEILGLESLDSMNNDDIQDGGVLASLLETNDAREDNDLDKDLVLDSSGLDTSSAGISDIQTDSIEQECIESQSFKKQDSVQKNINIQDFDINDSNNTLEDLLDSSDKTTSLETDRNPSLHLDGSLLENTDSAQSDLENLELEIENELMGIFENINDNKHDLHDTSMDQESINLDIQTQKEDFIVPSSNTDNNKDNMEYDQKNLGANNHTLSYIHTDMTKSHVFKTDPELSKICGKSLKS